jgi:L-iditol 2-dehydrogenase
LEKGENKNKVNDNEVNLMRVAMYYNNQDIRLEERPQPEIGEGELLIEVAASGICGTDVMEWYRIKKAPRILGHEITGRIIQSKSDKYNVGQRVFVSHHVPCYKCKYCLEDNHTACNTLHSGNYDPGGYSEFIRIPKINVDHGIYVLPDTMTYEEGTFVEPFACAVRGQRVIGVKEGQTVLILGSGVSGLLNIQLAKLIGAKVIATDIEEARLEKAKQFGADEAINARQELSVKADRIIICTGALAAVGQAFNCIDKKGIILLFAIPSEDIKIPTTDVWRNEITITSSYGAAPVDLEESLELIKSKEINVKDMITHRLPLEEIQQGFKIVTDGKESLKVVLEPQRKT